MTYSEIVTRTAEVFEDAGIAILVVGALVTVVRWLQRLAAHEDGTAQYKGARRDFGRSVLLGLEVFVAGDIIRTVGIKPTFTSVGVLGLIVLVRTFLSFSLEIELDGVLPWKARSEVGAEDQVVSGP
jgi:uncharacterized membrane protein